MKNKIIQSVNQSIQALEQLASPKGVEFVETAANVIADCFRKGNKLLIAGNGGSLCDASHFAEELTGIFRKKRRALPAIVLGEPGHVTCVANDLGFEQIFSRAIEAYGKPGDVFVGLTTSGNSANLVRGFAQAEEMELQTIAFLGKGGGKLKGTAHIEWIVEGFSTSDRIQEAHMTAIHILIEMVEDLLFYAEKEREIEDILSNASLRN